MPIDVTNFGLQEMLRCGNALRNLTRDQRSLELAGQKACRFLYDELGTPEGERACALVRCYKLHRFSELPQDLSEVAARSLASGQWPAPDMRCLTLLATAGDEPAWNDRRASVGHRAIPLPTPAMVERAPMIAALFSALGIDIAQLLSASQEMVAHTGGKSYGVFHVPDARGNSYIPAQDFVLAYGIRSVIGFGGSLQNGDPFAMILFVRVPVSAESAQRFRTIALDLKSRFFFYRPDQVFEQ